MNEVFLLLGSNIDPEINILLALEYLQGNFKIVDVSNTWQTKPVGSNAADFLNTAVRLETSLDAYTLKEQCLCHIEEKLGRVRQADKNAPRTIDLDIVIYNQQVIDRSLFVYPHMILPFAELLPDLKDDATGKTLYELSVQEQKKALATKYKCLLPPFQK